MVRVTRGAIAASLGVHAAAAVTVWVLAARVRSLPPAPVATLGAGAIEVVFSARADKTFGEKFPVTGQDDQSHGVGLGAGRPGFRDERFVRLVAEDTNSASPPTYPEIARRRRWTGLVRLEIDTDDSGRARDVRVTQSSGYPVLDEAALEAARTWRLQALARVSVPVEFRLSP